MEPQECAKHHLDSDTPTDTAYFRSNQSAPVRIVVSTATHLVPGQDYDERIEFLQNLISQLHWSCDFKEGDRFESYNAAFGSDNRACHFVLDHGQSRNGKDDEVPILWYRWTQEKQLVKQTDDLPRAMRRKLAKYPFTPSTPTTTVSGSRQWTALQQRDNILAKLQYDMGLSRQDYRFLNENLGHISWLKGKLNENQLRRFDSLQAENDEFEKLLACGKIRLVPPSQTQETPNSRLERKSILDIVKADPTTSLPQ